jgi:para-nitrobenzyl esterase
VSRNEPDAALTHREAPVVTTEYGRVVGVYSGGVAAFKGIPYAAPPLGRLRWRAPRPPEPWDGELDASRYGPIAPQPRAAISGDQPPTTSEDCLTLNVFAPRGAGDDLPVMVWIHGGAYYLGSSADPMFDGTGLARRGEVVVVTLNYRVGALGYLDFSSFATHDEPFESNLGQRDQMAALEWVQRNIAAFGGDPARVTVFGESAGGGAITTLMTTPSAADLFGGAIVESAPVGSVYSRERARGFAERFLGIVNVSARNIGLLRSLPVETLTDACETLVQSNPLSSPGTIAVAPVVDGELVPEYPLDAFRSGAALRVPMLIGTNRHEAQLFKLMRSPILPTTARGIDAMVENLGLREALAIPRAYRGYPSRAAALHISTDAAFRMPSIWAAAAHSEYAPTWMYEFDYVPPVLKALGLGAVHGSELPYVWGNKPGNPLAAVPLGGTKWAAQIAERIQSRWLEFAHTHEPNPPGIEPFWPRYDTKTRSTLMINRSDRIVDDPGYTQRRVWGDEIIAFR